MSTIGVTNAEFSCLDDMSGTVAEMQTTADPYPANSESLATTGAGEIQRLRFQIQRLLGLTYWFRNDENIRFDHSGGGTNIQGSGQARHVSAVGYHAWAGSARFPVYSTVNFHLTGLWFPRAGTQPRWTVAHHLAVSVGSGIDRDPTGIEVARFHLQALTLHHTVALRFAHSNAGLAAWQYPHITALQVRRPQPGPDGALPNMADISDQIIVGHRSVALQLQGASLIPAANRLLMYGPSAEYVQAVTISGGLTVTHQAGQLVFGSAASAGLWGSRGQFSGTGGQANAGHIFTLRAHVVQLMNASTHALTIRVAPAAINVDISDDNGDAGGAAPNGRDRRATFDASSWIHFYWIWHSGSGLLRGVASPSEPTTGPNLPTGFESWAYAGPVRRGTIIASPLIGTHIMGAMAYYHAAQAILANGTATSETTVDASSFVPPNATAMQLLAFNAANTAAVRALDIRVVTGLTFALINEGNTAFETVVLRLPNISQRFFYLWVDAPGTGVDFEIQGYAVPNGGS